MYSAANFWYNGDLCVKTSWKFYCGRISTFRDIWGKHDFTPSERFLIKPIWRGMNCGVTGSTTVIWETRISYENCLFSCIAFSIYEHFFLNFLINTEWLNILLFEFKPIFYRTKMPNSDNCLLHEFRQMCNTFHI